jgi:hypothetical protein
VKKGYAESLNRKARALGYSSYSNYLKSSHWKDIRERQIREVGYECGACPSRVALQLHHKTYQRLGAELVTDLEWLCDLCHKKTHKIPTGGIKNPKRRNVTVKYIEPSPRGRKRPSVQSANKRAKRAKKVTAKYDTSTLDKDRALIIALTRRCHVTRPNLLHKTGWNEVRMSAVIKSLMTDGIIEKTGQGIRVLNPSKFRPQGTQY